MAGLFSFVGNALDNAIIVADTATEMTVDTVKGTREICSDLGAGIKNKAALFREQSDEELQIWRNNKELRFAKASVKADVEYFKSLGKTLSKVLDIENPTIENLTSEAETLHNSVRDSVTKLFNYSEE